MTRILFEYGLIKEDDIKSCNELLKIVSDKIEKVPDLGARKWYIKEIGDILCYRLEHVILKDIEQIAKFIRDVKEISSMYQVIEYLKHERASAINRVNGIDDFEKLIKEFKDEYIIIDHNRFMHIKKKESGDRLLTIKLDG